MWIETNDPERHLDSIISHCYTQSENKDLYPVIIIDIDRETDGSNQLKAHVMTCIDEEFGWAILDDEPDWIVAEKDEMLNHAKEMIGENA